MSTLIGLTISAVFAILSTLRLAAVSGVALENRIPFGLAIWLLFLMLVITPMRMWKEHTDTIARLTTRRLVVSRKPVVPSENEVWLSLKVENKSGLVARRCYGKILTYQSLSEIDSARRLPGPGLKLPWSWFSSASARHVDIAAGSFDFLDIAMARGLNAKGFVTPMPPVGTKTAPHLSFGLPRGTYEVAIEVGSEADGFSPTKVLLLITYEDGLGLDYEIKHTDPAQ